MIPYILNEDRICVFVGGNPVTLTKSDERFESLIEALRSKVSEDEIKDILNSNKKVIPVTDTVFKDLPPALEKRVFYLKSNGLSLEPIKRFIENLKKNPSQDSRSDLYAFLEACDLPITEDGCFLAYKRVTADYKDFHTRSFDNSVGKIVEMPRKAVDPNREQTCSTGLHVCSKAYLASFGGEITIVVKVNPEDVVAVPVDYQNAKMRVCKYEVIGSILPEKGESIKPMAVTKKKKVSKIKGSTKARVVMQEINKSERFDAYVQERNLPEEISTMTKNQREALRKFAARILYGKAHAAGKEINACKTLVQLKKTVCGE